MDDSFLEELCDETREALFEVVRNILKTEDYKISTEPGSKKGDNFIGIVYRILFSSADGKQSSSLFLKIAPTDEAKREMFLVHPCFMKETYAYEVVLPYFREFQESRNVFKDGFIEYPKLYKSIMTEPTESLFFQDMALDGFIMIDKTNVMVEHILLVMKTLGKFHAVSFALRDQDPEKFTELVNPLQEMFFVRGTEATFVVQINNAAMNAIDCITDDSDAHLVTALMNLYETNQYDLIADLLNGSDAEPYAVVTHGDAWSNNTMFRYDEKNTLQDMCLIDWQIIRYGSPVIDLMYYLFSCTTRELRGRNYNIYLKTYYDSLASLLTRLGSDPERVFPFNAFQEQLRKYGKYGLLNATFILPMQYEEFTADNNEFGVGQLSDGFKKRIRDIVSDMYQLGYL